MNDIMFKILMFIIIILIICVVICVLHIIYDKKEFNKGVCKHCRHELRLDRFHNQTTSRNYFCPNCYHSVTVYFNIIDKNLSKYKKQRKYKRKSRI